ncbi:MAG: VWA domain-containing protein [Saprospiraceae bacterium]
MKKIILSFFFLFIYSNLAFSNGVCIVDNDNNIYFEMKSSHLDVNINNQVATIVSTQVFTNTTGIETLVKFGYPLTETASATQLRWQINGDWFYASFAPTAQDTILPGSGGGGVGDISNAQEYLGEFPLYFNLEQLIPPGLEITFELTYVDLLPYAFNIVTFSHEGDYSLIQSNPLETFEINYHLISSRTIDWVDLVDQPDEVISNTGNEADLTFSKTNFSLNQDIIIEYQLNASELGLFDFSTFIPDSILACDNHGEGFFTLIIEPDPSNNTQTIDKIFTLVIDRSGSMGGDKIMQAREAATFIINNLNIGDEFNIVDFSSEVTSFQPDHVPFNLNNQNAALAYIQGIDAGGGTHILDALETSISQFSDNDPDKASIILFFTDGIASNSTTDILQGVSNAITINNVEDLSIFSFGIGDDVNKQLLTLLATQNNGFAEFVDNQALAEVISQFYLTVQNPVLLNTTITFSPEVVIEAYT